MKSKASKQNSNLSVPEIGKEMSFCISNGVKVYPIEKKGKWFIESEVNSIIKTFDKAIDKTEIQDAIYKTWIHYYNKLKNAKNGINKGNNNT